MSSCVVTDVIAPPLGTRDIGIRNSPFGRQADDRCSLFDPVDHIRESVRRLTRKGIGIGDFVVAQPVHVGTLEAERVKLRIVEHRVVDRRR